jgi:hypothetical protein
MTPACNRTSDHHSILVHVVELNIEPDNNDYAAERRMRMLSFLWAADDVMSAGMQSGC